MSVAGNIEIWGTYSVKDHTQRRPFVADVMLYDRLVVPFPPDDEEKERWRVNGWQPSRLNSCLDILDDLAIPLPWDAERKKAFRDQSSLAKDLNPFYLSSLQLSLEAKGFPRDRIPLGVDSIRPVAAYRSFSTFEQQVSVSAARPGKADREGELAAVFAREFHVPDDPRLSDLKLLEQAAGLARDPEFRAKRSAFHQWLEDAIRRGLENREAVAEMHNRIRECDDVIKRMRVRSRAKFAFLATKLCLAGGSVLAVAGAFPPLAPILGNAAVMLVEYSMLQGKPELQLPRDTPAAMFYTARKHFGWK
jgi:hypothetical protein